MHLNDNAAFSAYSIRFSLADIAANRSIGQSGLKRDIRCKLHQLPLRETFQTFAAAAPMSASEVDSAKGGLRKYRL